MTGSVISAIWVSCLIVQFYTQAGTIVGIELAVFEVQALGQVGQSAALVVVLHQDADRKTCPGN